MGTMKVFILLSFVAVAFASRECGQNQHYDSCGTACPLTCENYQNPPVACILMCNPGCHCDEGYVKTKNGACVMPEQCPLSSDQVCGENEQFNDCGTACPLTCENKDNPPRFCQLSCEIGCQCKKGFVLTSDKRCVRPEECPARSDVCGENEKFTNCGTACPLTCENYDNPPRICPLSCFIGCQCEKGFVLTSDKRCVRPEECPARADVLKTCLEEKDPGMCRAYMPMWYYDVETEKCLRFVYGGCGGNGNRYATEEECMNHCGDVLSESTAEICALPAETGPCRAMMPRYHFNKKTGECERFVYGGCGGNENNFQTVEDCENACK